MLYDLMIIGGGPAGYLAAERAGHEGLNVLLIEKRALGGVCLNEGCVPSKALLYSAKVLDTARHGEKYGVRVEKAELDHGAVIKRKNKVVKTLVAGIKGTLQRSKVTVVEGKAEITGRNGEGYEVKAGETVYSGKRLLIATGSVPVVPPIPGVKEGIAEGYVLTNREILDLETVPSTLTIVGGGVIGLEMASYYQSAGSKVTVVEMLDHIGGFIDSEISEFLLKSYQKKGIEFKLGSRVTGVQKGLVTYETNGSTFSVEADKILLSIGRRAATEELGLDRIGVETERGRIKTDDRGKTNVPEVYAAGDVNGVSMLAHTAYREAEVCINTILGKKDKMRYHAIPSVIYTNPEVGAVGETEQSARQKGLEFGIKKLSMRYSGRFLAENEGGDGLCKILFDTNDHRIIGVHMVGNYSSEIIYGAALMIETEMRVEDVQELVFPHPTVCEIIRETLFS